MMVILRCLRGFHFHQMSFSSGAGRTSDGNGSHASTLKSPSYTKSVRWQHFQGKQQVEQAINRSLNLVP
ncbi:hypothetical protein PSX78_23530, partial [Shigella flexneri]|nr:hypothetical protein [Shigella flexneri]